MSTTTCGATLGGLFLLSVVTPGVSMRGAEQKPESRAPNIIYIMADDLGYGELGSYGQKKIRTPRLDRMAAEGMRFTQFYSGSPVCAPSRATLVTGVHTGHAHVRDNHELGGFLDEEERGQLALQPDTPTLARALSSRGYTTAIVGKWGLGGPGSTGVPTRQGFDLFFGYLDQKQAHNFRVPMIVRWPGRIAKATTSDHVAANWDMWATFSELAGAPVREKSDGISMLPALLGAPKGRQHEFLYWEYHSQGSAQAVRMGRWKGIRNNAKANPNGPIELYDLEADLAEKADVSSKHPDIVRRIVEIMRASHTPSQLAKWNF